MFPWKKYPSEGKLKSNLNKFLLVVSRGFILADKSQLSTTRTFFLWNLLKIPVSILLIIPFNFQYSCKSL